MNRLQSLTGKSGKAAIPLFRALSLFLAVIIAAHLLPFSLLQDDFPLSSIPTEYSFSIEPLDICDDGSDLTGFLSDHPWVMSSDLPPLFVMDGNCCPSPLEKEIADGVPSAVYRPPRTILS